MAKRVQSVSMCGPDPQKIRRLGLSRKGDRIMKKAQCLWIKPEGNQYRIGMTPELQEDAGDISYANIFSGQRIEADETLLNIEASKAAIEIVSPLTGTLVAINQAAIDNPALLNSTDPAEHWIALLADVDPAEYDSL